MHGCIKALRRGIPALPIVCLAVTSVLIAAPQQADRGQTETLARRAGERMQSLQREADQLASREKTLLGDLRKLEIDRQINIEQLRVLDAEAAIVTRDLTDATGRLTRLQQEDVAVRPTLEARLVEMYKLGQARYVRLLLSTSDARRIGEASRTVAAMAKLDRDRIAAHQRTLNELASTQATLEDRSRRLEVLHVNALRANADVARAAQARSDMIRDIDRQRDLNAQLAGELQGAQQNLQVALRNLSAAAPTSLPFRPFRGALEWPVAGPLRRRFSQPPGGNGAAYNGVEIDAVDGTPVTAIHEGLVAYADAFSGFGNLVILDHGGQTFTLYGNLLEIAVTKGARVEAGQALGTVGTSPTGPAALYFELRVDGRPVDPVQWLKKR